MEGRLGVRHFSRSEGPGAPPKTAQAMEELTLHMKETLDVLTPLELRNFRDILKKVDEEPRVTQVQLELEGDNTWKLARLLAKQYYASAPRVLTKVLQQLPRADLLPRWEIDPPANGPGERRDPRAGSTGGRWFWGCAGVWPLRQEISVPVPWGDSARSGAAGKGHASKEGASFEGTIESAVGGGSPGVHGQDSRHFQASWRYWPVGEEPQGSTSSFWGGLRNQVDSTGRGCILKSTSK